MFRKWAVWTAKVNGEPMMIDVSKSFRDKNWRNGLGMDSAA